MATALTDKQKRLKDLAEKVVLSDKIERQNVIKTMRDLISTMTSNELIDVINTINSPVALKFLIPAGVYGDAHGVLFAKLGALQKSGK